MVQVPVRVLGAFRTGVAPGLLGATAVSTAVFSATPLVLPELLDAFDVGRGVVGIVSGVQLAGFVLSTFFSPRVARPSAGAFVLALVVLTAANATGAAVDDFWIFVATRAVAGVALGVLTWLAWESVFGDASRMGDIAVVGPIAGVVAAPVFGVVLSVGGYRWLYAVLAVVGLLPALRPPQFPRGGAERPERRRGGAPAAYAVVAALGLLTMGGSAVFIYSGVIGADRAGLSAASLSAVYAANAAAGIPSARWRGRRPAAGLWLAITGALAWMVATAPASWILVAALVAWGFTFWVGVPATYSLLSARSRFPAERAGDAQAVMAAGRIVGPLLGGALVASGSFAALGVVGGGLMVAAGAIVLVVEYGMGAPGR
ncbi:MAG: MFS transporter [Acidimicrobiales bacterium]